MISDKWLNGKTCWNCHNWKELEEALGECSVPFVLATSFSSKNGLKEVTIGDDLVHNPEDYDWSNVPIECDECGWKGKFKDLITTELREEKCPKCHNILLGN